MGATYLTLKTTGEIHDRAQKASATIGGVAILVTFGFMTWVHVGLGTGFVPKPIEALGLFAVIAAAWAAQAKAEGWAFTAAAIGIAGAVGTIFSELYPRVMISSTNAAYNLTDLEHSQPRLFVAGDDGGGGRVLSCRALLPDLGLLHLPQAPLRAANDGSERPVDTASTEAATPAEST